MRCERSLHACVRRDHRAARIGLDAQIVQRLVQDVGERLRGVEIPRKPPPAPALGDEERSDRDPARPEDGEQRRQAELSMVRRGA